MKAWMADRKGESEGKEKEIKSMDRYGMSLLRSIDNDQQPL